MSGETQSELESAPTHPTVRHIIATMPECWPFSELERIVVWELESSRYKDEPLADVLTSITRKIEWAQQDGDPVDTLTGIEHGDIERTVNALRSCGFVELVTGTFARGFYRLTPKGRVALTIDQRDRFRARRHARQGRQPPKPSPLPDDIGATYEELKIGQIDIGKRTANRLEESGVCTVGDVLSLPRKALLAIPGIGRKSLEMLEFEFGQMGLDLRKE